MSASAFGTALALSSLSMRPGEGTLDASDDSQAIELHDDGHSHALLRSFQRLREVDMLCDLTLRVDGGLAEYRVHRALLCAACPYFETMFMCGLQESTSACVDLHVAPVPAHIVGLLIDYFYTGTVKLRGGEFELLPLLCLADEYDCVELRARCLPLLSQRLSPNNCLAWLQVADSLPSCESWRVQCLAYVLEHFPLMPIDDFLPLSASVLYEIIASPALNLSVQHEALVLSVVSKWLIRHVRSFRRYWLRDMRVRMRFLKRHAANADSASPAPTPAPPLPSPFVFGGPRRNTLSGDSLIPPAARPKLIRSGTSVSTYRPSVKSEFDPYAYASRRGSVFSSSALPSQLSEASGPDSPSLDSLSADGSMSDLKLPPLSPISSGVPPFFSYAPQFGRPGSAQSSKASLAPSPPTFPASPLAARKDARPTSVTSHFSTSFTLGQSHASGTASALPTSNVTAPAEDVKWLSSPLAACFAMLHHIRLAAILPAELDLFVPSLLRTLRRLPLGSLALPETSSNSSTSRASLVGSSISRSQASHSGLSDVEEISSASEVSSDDESSESTTDALAEWQRCGGADWAASPVHAVILQQLSLPTLQLHRVPLLIQGRCVKNLRGHVAPVCALASNDQYVVSGSHDRTLRVWQRDTDANVSSRGLTNLTTLTGHTDRIHAVAFGRGERADTLFSSSGSNDSVIKVWNVHTWRCEDHLKGHTDMVFSLIGMGELLVSASFDETIRVWSRKKSDAPPPRLVSHQSASSSRLGGATSAAASVARPKSGGPNGASVVQWSCDKVLTGHTRAVKTLAVHPTRTLLFSGSYDTTIRVWQCDGPPSEWRCCQVLRAHSDWVCALVFWRDMLVSSSLDGTVRLWNDCSSDGSWQCVGVLPSTGVSGPNAFADAMCVVNGVLCTSINGFWYAWHPDTRELIRPDLNVQHDVELADQAPVGRANTTRLRRFNSDSIVEQTDLNVNVAVDFRAASFVGVPAPLAASPAQVSSTDDPSLGIGGAALCILPCEDRHGRFNVIGASRDAMVRLWDIKIVSDVPDF